MSVISTPPLNDGVTTYAGSPLTHTIRTYANYAQNLFKKENYLRLLFSEDEENTDIIIRVGNSINSENLNKKPAVLIHRSGFAFNPMSISGDMSNHNFRTGTTEREAMLQGQIFYTVIARPDHVADEIAWYLVENTWLLKNVEGGQLFQGSQSYSISPPSNPQGIVQGDMSDLVAVQVAFPVKLLRRSEVTPMGQPALNATTMRLRDSSTQSTLLDVQLENEGNE